MQMLLASDIRDKASHCAEVRLDPSRRGVQARRKLLRVHCRRYYSRAPIYRLNCDSADDEGE